MVTNVKVVLKSFLTIKITVWYIVLKRKYITITQCFIFIRTKKCLKWAYEYQNISYETNEREYIH